MNQSYCAAGFWGKKSLNGVMKFLKEVSSASAAFRSCSTVVFSVHCRMCWQYIFYEHVSTLLVCLLKSQQVPENKGRY